MKPQLTDMVGQPINEGDYVAYATHKGSWQKMHVMRVDKIEYEPPRDWHREVWTLRGEVVTSTDSWAHNLPRKVRVSVRDNGWIKVQWPGAQQPV